MLSESYSCTTYVAIHDSRSERGNQAVAVAAASATCPAARFRRRGFHRVHRTANFGLVPGLRLAVAR